MPIYVLTGANRGLGLEFTRQLSADSSNTIIASVRTLSNDLSDLKALNKSNNIHILECDQSNVKSVQSFAQEVIKTLDGKKINYLLCNGGINANPEELSTSIVPEHLHHHIDVNVLGPAKLTESLKDHLAPKSVIMNMTSGLGSMQVNLGIAPRKCCTYSISKAALNMLTVHQAYDYKETSTVICMDPGWVKTRMGGEGAMIEAHESIGGMLKTLHSLDESKTGKFYVYNGDEVPW